MYNDTARAMIKVAIAGTNGLAQLLAHYIDTTTSHQFVFLSRRVSRIPKGPNMLTIS